MNCPSARRARLVSLITVLCALAATALDSRAVILYRTGDPAANTTGPGGDLAGSGWQFEGTFGGFLGTPVAPHFFASARHIGQAGPYFTFAGVNYTIVKEFPDPNSDLDLWQVAETFPLFAPLYTKFDEIGKVAVVIGRGTQRGTEVFVDGTLRGWNWGASDGVERWGDNVISDIVVAASDNEYLYGTFDAAGLPDEATLSSGDSGGAAFIQDGDVWKLAGIHYAVDGPFYTDASGNGSFLAALFDARGLFYFDGANYVEITGPDPLPAGFYPTRISSKLAWIYSVTDPAGDADGDGIANLLEYALHADPLTPDVARLPVVALEGSDLTLTYFKVTTATDIQYTVEQSFDLVAWTTASSIDEVVATDANVETIKAKVPTNGAPQLFLRLRITRL
jgi:hypothetical protein